MSDNDSSQSTGASNTWLDKLKKTQFHLPQYSFCGPNTNVYGQLETKTPRNTLDKYCQSHDIAYTLSKDKEHRRKHDILLAERAEKNYKKKETPLREKVESYLVSKVMRAKAMLGKGISTRKKSKSKKKQNKKRKSAKPRAVAVGRVIPLPQSGSGLIPILSAIAKVINLGIGVREAYKGIKQLMKEGKPSVGKEQKIGAGLFLRKQPNGDRYSLRVVT
jgi:hypothetical protein